MARSRGFTLIEMLVVLSIMSMLALAAKPVLQLSVQRHKEFALREALRSIRSAIDAYKLAADWGRIALSADGRGYPPSLQALVEGVPDIRSPRGGKIYFMRRLPRDPFAQAELTAAETWGLRDSASPPDAPRAGKDVFDVYSRSEQTALDGTRYGEW